ncbi:hypothetical protein FGG08_004585 [Glutinoglossum americanum]|uniref:Uncharacterized protein n=1 Tax=Glutinoglossum americanum TaxID=1670608 RepID=A0A9P8I796_9PEZI|nr:hypothetical protein FGG08_004585 [Glutinoglossum americanum]
MPALTISTQHGRPNYERRRSNSPPRPPVSPITPVLSPATLVPPTASTNTAATPSATVASTPFNQQTHVAPPPTAGHPTPFIQHPAPIPISESENPDAIALRSAISILQLQRERSKADLRALQTLKEKAVAEPEEFANDLLAGRVKSADQSKGLLGVDLGDVSHRRSHDEMKTPSSMPKTDALGDKMDVDGDDEESQPSYRSKFSPIPTPQNVVRCPPINWAKYHIVGESLDKLHEEQRRRPTQGEPQRDGGGRGVPRAPVAVVAAPYRPFIDRVAEPMRTRSGGKRG